MKQKQTQTTARHEALDCRPVRLSEVKAGEFIKRKPDAKTVFVREHFDRASRSYCLSDTDDMNRSIFLKGSAVVYVGFTF
jgi:hypothetical protein